VAAIARPDASTATFCFVFTTIGLIDMKDPRAT
jgi:hypothetical protein